MHDYKFKLITIDEFEKLARLFPENEERWQKYRLTRLNELINKEADIFVIDYKGIFIGEIAVNYISHSLITETIPDFRVYFEGFRIDKSYQNEGLGQKLLAYAMNYLKDKGYIEFTIGVEENNVVAKHIYNKFGFTKAIDEGYGNPLEPCVYTLYLNDKIKDSYLK